MMFQLSRCGKQRVKILKSIKPGCCKVKHIPPAQHSTPDTWPGVSGEEPASHWLLSAWLACLGLVPAPHSGLSGVVTLLHGAMSGAARAWPKLFVIILGAGERKVKENYQEGETGTFRF